MNVILNYFIEANLGLVLFYFIYRFMLTDETSFTFRRIYLLGSIFISLLFPFFTIGETTSLPTLSSVIPTTYLPEVTTNLVTEQPTTVEDHQINSPWLIVKWIYFIGFTFLMTRFFYQLTKLIIYLRPVEFQSHHAVKIISTPLPQPTFSFFNYIVIGNLKELSEGELNQIISHELAHARRLHSLDVLFIELLRTVFWFNPVLYYYKRSMILIHEFQADADTVANGDADKYCNLLARIALLTADYRLANQFTNSITLKRITMLKTLKKKVSTWKLAVMIPLIAGFFFIVACQDQVMNEISEVAQNATMATDLPPEVQAKLEQLKLEDPTKEWIVVELNEEGKKKAEELFNRSGTKNIVFMNAVEKDGTKREFSLYNFDENAKKVADLSKDVTEVFTIVEESASYPGGMNVLYEDVIAPNLQYPAKAKEMGIEGKVFIQAIVEKDGTLSDLQIVKGIGAGCDEEALRVLSQSGTWIPGKQRGIIVRQKIVLPVFFNLTKNQSGMGFSDVQEAVNHATASNNIAHNPVIQRDGVFTRVEQSATYPGGMEKFYEFFNQNYKYPDQARNLGIEGKVFIQFIVEKDGTLADLKIVKGIGGGCDQEAARVLGLSKKWTPGKQGGKAVSQQIVIPVFFKL